MKRLGGRIALCALLLTVALVGSSLAASDTQTVKVGLAYSSGALASANLENSVGNGFSLVIMMELEHSSRWAAPTPPRSLC